MNSDFKSVAQKPATSRVSQGQGSDSDGGVRVCTIHLSPGRSLSSRAPVLHGVEVGICTAGGTIGQRLEQAEPEAARDTKVRAAVQEGAKEGAVGIESSFKR